ncbi:MAG: hypothetical protein ABEJ31_03080 [Haloarculaceae archaeon]
MTPERRVLLVDGLAGLAVLAVGMGLLDAPLQWWVLVLASVTAISVAGVLFGVERDQFESIGRALLVAALFVLAPLGVAAATALARPTLGAALAFAVFLGVGGGIIGYRFVFGVLRPVPERRLERARDRAV